ncbi:hypothetical protein ABZ461_12430 [Actinacidiphila glaucinigra]|uniref:hypothetical protein n=1 Tax=Actinacidiphila glaucinigra TaxID=235986 RepID=UPI0033E00B3A
MSKEVSEGRPALRGIEASGEFPVEYRFAHAKNGNRHLVVVFANFSAPLDYGWSNGVFDGLRANILWIRDRFDGMNSYYLCKDMDFALEESVVTLVWKVMEALALTPDQCTLWGGSKGGSAALYFGLKYGFRNIVSLVPQFLVGSYVERYHPKVARFMMGEVSEQNVRILDSAIPNLVRSGANRSANLYLLSSRQDAQYEEQIAPFIGLFQGYENFNFIYSDSPFIADHTEVTRRNVPPLMGLAHLLVDGIAPRIGFVQNGFEEPRRDRSAIDSYLKATAVRQDHALAAPVVTAPAPGQRVPGGAVRISGTAPGAIRVSLWENGRYLGSGAVGADGTWSWGSDRPWGEGKHLVKAFAVDARGYESARTQVTFSVFSVTEEPAAAGVLGAAGP